MRKVLLFIVSIFVSCFCISAEKYDEDILINEEITTSKNLFCQMNCLHSVNLSEILAPKIRIKVIWGYEPDCHDGLFPPVCRLEILSIDFEKSSDILKGEMTLDNRELCLIFDESELNRSKHKDLVEEWMKSKRVNFKQDVKLSDEIIRKMGLHPNAKIDGTFNYEISILNNSVIIHIPRKNIL